MHLSCASLDATNLSRLQDRFCSPCISLGNDHRYPNAHVENLVHFLCINVSILLQDLEDARDPPAFASIIASQFEGRIRGRLSIKPPPVMWARPLIMPIGTFFKSG